MNATPRSAIAILALLVSTPACLEDRSDQPQPQEEAEEPQLVYGPKTLDTGIDLSHLKVEASDAASFPTYGERPPTPAPTPPAVGPPVSTGPPGKLEVTEGSGEKNFGELLEGDVASHTFLLRAAGENPLVIHRIKPSCGCTAAEIHIVGADGEKGLYTMGDEIPVGTVLEIPTEIKTAGRSGPMRTNVAIYSNDAASPLRIQLAADVKPVLTVEPKLLDLQRITSADTKEGMLRVETTVLEPFLLTLDQATVLEPLAVELEPVDPDENGKSRVWDIHVTLGPNTPEGIRRYPLRLITDLPGGKGKGNRGGGGGGGGRGGAGGKDGEDGKAVKFRELHANIQAQVTGMVVATPNFISLGLVRPGQVVKRTVRLKSLDDDYRLPSQIDYRVLDLREEEFALAHVFSVEVEPIDEGRVVDVHVTLEGLPDELNGSFGGMVQLDVGHPTKPSLNVRFSGVCRPGNPAAGAKNESRPGG